MKKKTAKGKPGRKKTKLDWGYIDELLKAGCKGGTIAAKHNITSNTFCRLCAEEKGLSFSEYATQKKLEGDALILHALYDEAVNKRNKTMLIFICKTRLKMVEASQYDKNTPDIRAVTIMNYSNKAITPWRDDEAVVEVPNE